MWEMDNEKEANKGNLLMETTQKEGSKYAQIPEIVNTPKVK